MFVHQTELFKGMNQAFLDKLNEILVTENYNRGDFLFKVGEPAHHFFILLQGRVRIAIGEKGHTVTIASNPGKLSDGHAWSALIPILLQLNV